VKRSRAVAHGRSALTTRYGAPPPEPTAASSPAETAAPWPPPGSATAIAPPAGVPSGATTTVGPRVTHASRTSASLAGARSARASRRSRPSRLLPSTPLNGTTTVGIARDPTAAATGDGSGAGRRERLQRPEEAAGHSARDQHPRCAERRQLQIRLDPALPVL